MTAFGVATKRTMRVRLSLRLIAFAAGALMALFPATSLAAPRAGSARVAGRVLDPAGTPVSDARVTLSRGAVGLQQAVSTSADGRYAFEGLASGQYLLEVRREGFSVSARPLELASGQTLALDVVLWQGSFSEEVNVSAARVAGNPEEVRRIPGAVEVLDRDALESSGVFTTSEALRKVSGTHVRDEEGFGLRPNIGIRGLNPTRSTKVLLLEDGIPLTYAPYGDNASYYHPPIDRFERLEVLKGGAQIAYGPQTVGGAINYLTPKPPAQRTGSLTLMGGNRDYFNGHGSYGATVGRTGFLIDYMRKQSDGSRDNLNFKLNDVNGKVVQGVGARQTWTFRGNYYSEDSNVTYSGLRQDEYVANSRANPFSNDFFYADRYGASATHAFAVSGDVAMTTN